MPLHMGIKLILGIVINPFNYKFLKCFYIVFLKKVIYNPYIHICKLSLDINSLKNDFEVKYCLRNIH